MFCCNSVYSFSPQYCEYMPDVAKCRQWLEKNFPNEFAKLTVGMNIFFLSSKLLYPKQMHIRYYFKDTKVFW